MTRKVTMTDLALVAGCSRSQVSRALNGKANVAPEVRAQVLAAAAKLNYRNTANRHQIRIAVIIQRIGGAYGQQMVDALINAAAGRKWICQIIQERSLDQVSPYFFDGVVSLIYNNSWARKWIEERAIPLVMVNSYGTVFDQVYSVDPDSCQGSRIVLRYLKELGHRKIARIHFVDEEQSAYHRGEKEFLDAAAQLNLGDSVRNFQISFPQISKRWEAFRAVLAEDFTAIYMIHQHLAIPAANFIQEAGYRIPEDVSIIGFDDVPMCDMMVPPLSTMKVRKRELGATAVQRLLDRVADPKRECLKMCMATKLVKRQSVSKR